MAVDPLQSIKQRFGIIGRSESLTRALNTATRVAPTDLTVLITGESGVGKEVFSKIIHHLSPRKHEDLIAINTGALPAGTINSELFGHEKGAFTDASTSRKGYFETLNGGTIFLDEIGEMPMETQAYLLRVLESGEFLRVGSSKVQKTDIRIIAATNVDLESLVKKGKFREDLYYRLNTVPIKVPALHERRDDIYMLFRKFALDFSEKYHTPSIQIDDDSRLIIENYRWPGNVRELKNIVEQLSVMSEEREIEALQLLDIAPHLNFRNLPSISEKSNGQGPGGAGLGDNYEREILYKLLFDMRNDMTDLKKMIFEMIRINDLSVPDKLQASQANYSENYPAKYEPNFSRPEQQNYDPIYDQENNQPILVTNNDYDESEIVEEDLSLENMEKDMIKKALSKYRGRRKDAAEELGISERTLYRKIKQYDIDQ
ncbi:sigma-54 dependent transcriptional regulator [Saprospiraceae bacterium]|nr:sigma-54 dependent transcriptional regulator [Saprospiraceae bacterium]